MGMTVEQLAAARGRTVQEVLAACQRTGVLAWSGFTPLDDTEVGKIDAALGAAPGGAGGGAGWGAPPPPPGTGAPPPPPAFGAPPPPDGRTGPMAPGPHPPIPHAPSKPGRGLGVAGGRIVRTLVALGVVVGGRAYFAAQDQDEADQEARDTVAELADTQAGDVVDEDLAAFGLVVGDCFDDLSGIAVDSTESVDARLREVDCAVGHDAEVYATPVHPDPIDAPYPGEDAIAAFADQACYDAFTTFVGVPLEQSTLSFYFTFPQERSWEVLDDRGIACSVVTVDGSLLTGTVAGSSR